MEAFLIGQRAEWRIHCDWLMGSVRGYHIHTHSVVISVLADLLMLTCSACLLGSWGSILSLSHLSFLSFLYAVIVVFFFVPEIWFVMAFYVVFTFQFILFWAIWSRTPVNVNFCLMDVRVCVCTCGCLHYHTPQNIHLFLAKHRGTDCTAGLGTAS